MTTKRDNGTLPLALAQRVSHVANTAWRNGSMIEAVTPITRDLLRFWFEEPFTDRSRNFHEGQRQAILNIIYLHEVLRIADVQELYYRLMPGELTMADLATLQADKYSMPKYAVKLATGTGKTWVMHAVVIWQLLNALHEEGTPSGRYTRNFLIVAPGLIVYDRLQDAYLGRLHRGTAQRDITTNDLYQNQELFLPPTYRHEVFSFVANNVVTKEEGIGQKVTSGGMIAITNWHLFLRGKEKETTLVDELPPLSPGTTAGNSLDTLDSKYLRGTDVDYLRQLPDLMVINDETHHLHETKTDEVQWQQGLDTIAENKQGRIVQVDFSATPYTTKGSGRNLQKVYFPHIVVDFDLKAAMQRGLVKTLLLDKRKELTDIEDLDFTALRDGKKVLSLSEGQRIMLRAGLTKLRILESGFAKVDSHKCPKMMVVCEDTMVTPYVENFLIDEGLDADDVLRIDITAQGEVKPSEWQRVKERLSNMDHYAQPRVVVSVMMLREGFDVNNICVIVPLRSAGAPILLEQIVGRGLRLMWREPDLADEKAENRRAVLVDKCEPRSYLDMLSIVEHPRFEAFYDDLVSDGLVATDGTDFDEDTNVVGDVVTVGLKEDYEQYDLCWINIVREAVEELSPATIDVAKMKVFSMFSLDQLRRLIVTQGETFISQVVSVKTLFGSYQVKGDLFTATSYNMYLQKIIHIVTHRMEKGRGTLPMLQINAADIARAVDAYIRTRLFGEAFDPFHEGDWKILLAQNGEVSRHIVSQLAEAIYQMQQQVETEQAEVVQIPFSSVSSLKMRESYSLELCKTIYERTAYPSHGGGFERAFLEFIDCDASVERFIKVNEYQHSFAVVYYLRTDGLLATYHPDFIVQTKQGIYVVETKGNDKIADGNVIQKRKATAEWCKKINTLEPAQRCHREWHYVLLSENTFYSYRKASATFNDICLQSKVSVNETQDTLFEV